MTEKRVAFCGLAGSGKSRAADVFTQSFDADKFSFATPMKEVLIEAGVLTHDECYNPKFKQAPNKEKIIRRVSGELGGLDKVTIAICKGILTRLGCSEFGANARLMDEPQTPMAMLKGLTGDQMYGDVRLALFDWLNEESTSPRRVMQQLGTDVMRKWNHEVHVIMAREALKDKIGNLTCDDARFPNELRMLKEFGFKVVWLNRAALAAKDFHSSETSITESHCDEVMESPEGTLLDYKVEMMYDKHLTQTATLQDGEEATSEL